jgi:hypothetical protein
MMASVGSVCAKLIAVAPKRPAGARRSGCWSTTNTWLAPRGIALCAAISPTGPDPKITTVSPGLTFASSVAW